MKDDKIDDLLEKSFSDTCEACLKFQEDFYSSNEAHERCHHQDEEVQILPSNDTRYKEASN